MRVDDGETDRRIEKKVGDDIQFVTRCMLCCPVHDRNGDVYGCLQVINKQEDDDTSFSDFQGEVLADLAHNIGPVIQGWMSFFDAKTRLSSQLHEAVAGERQMAGVIGFLLQSGGQQLRDTIGEDLAIQLLNAANASQSADPLSPVQGS